ncbi:ParB/RepB/Spo0J family partition protein [Kineococcus radiotolerans]|uniref:ParB-like partition protein n=1 Tax=Kineococcus radiotolerans (strain ATCC BAA-149 / DSM 14245 / SRS30216) TaxID=266940 RepID=A6W8V9_KINRD|nr:ParB/RepB/Spo0J family partition protein [Kineococcus radiotolerans]ABS03248.1 parB-like partition protein [Kineococcus radiotolerans SRS30216 = ATCC BAA-149]
MSVAPRQELLTVPIEDVEPDPHNLREDVGDITELAQSIAETGLLQPVVVRRVHEVDERGDWSHDRYVVVAGHRRLAALQHLGRGHIQILVRDEMAPDEVLAAMLVENGQRTDLDPIEEARAMRKLADIHGLSHRDLAARIGKHQTAVSARLALLNLTKGEQESIRTGQMLIRDGVKRGRERGTRKLPGPRTDGGAWWFIATHPLAEAARKHCRRAGHGTGRLLGATACGQCWEAAIRADAAAQPAADRPIPAAPKPSPQQAAWSAKPTPVSTPAAVVHQLSIPTRRFFDQVEQLADTGCSVAEIVRAVDTPPYRIRVTYARHGRALPPVLQENP